MAMVECYVEDLREELAQHAAFCEEQIPQFVKRAIRLLNSDLYNGPLYFDREGEVCSCFEPGTRAFNFPAAAKMVMDYLEDSIEDLSVCVAFDDDTGEEIFERVEDSGRGTIKEILGVELYATIR